MYQQKLKPMKNFFTRLALAMIIKVKKLNASKIFVMKISTGENFLIYSMPKRTQNVQNSIIGTTHHVS